MNSSSARQLGDEVHQYLFWAKAAMMLQQGKIASVGYETQEFKAFDDVGIKYATSMPDGCGGSYDEAHIQAKFSVASIKSLSARSLADPKTINASTICILERLRDAVSKSEIEGRSCLFYFRSPWHIDSDDLLGKMYCRNNGGLKLATLFEGKTEKSESGRIRKLWSDKLKIDWNDRAAFDRILGRLRIEHEAMTFDEIRSDLATKLPASGLKALDISNLSDTYCNLIQRLSRSGCRWFDTKLIREACEQDNLWVGKPSMPEDGTSIGLRSFIRFSEGLEDEVDELLCLTEHFDGRFIRNERLWEQAVMPELQQFLSLNIKRGQSYCLHCPAVGSIAFASGYLIEPKIGAKVSIYQSGQAGRSLWSSTVGDGSQVSWDLENLDRNIDETDLVVAVSVSQNTKEAVEAFVEEGIPTVKNLIHFNLETIGHSALGDGQQSFAAADELSKIIASKKQEHGCTGRTHLFWSAPNAFVFMLGQCARNLGELQLYEFDFEGVGVRKYKKSISLSPAFRLA